MGLPGPLPGVGGMAFGLALASTQLLHKLPSWGLCLDFLIRVGAANFVLSPSNLLGDVRPVASPLGAPLGLSATVLGCQPSASLQSRVSSEAGMARCMQTAFPSFSVTGSTTSSSSRGTLRR